MSLWNQLHFPNVVSNEIKAKTGKALQSSKALTKVLINYHITNYFKYNSLAHNLIDANHIYKPQTKSKLKRELASLVTPPCYQFFEKIDSSERDTIPSICNSTIDIRKSQLKKSRNTISSIRPSFTKSTVISLKTCNKQDSDIRAQKEGIKNNSNSALRKPIRSTSYPKICFETTDDHNIKLQQSIALLMKANKNCQFNLKKIQIFQGYKRKIKK